MLTFKKGLTVPRGRVDNKAADNAHPRCKCCGIDVKNLPSPIQSFLGASTPRNPGDTDVVRYIERGAWMVDAYLLGAHDRKMRYTQQALFPLLLLTFNLPWGVANIVLHEACCVVEAVREQRQRDQTEHHGHHPPSARHHAVVAVTKEWRTKGSKVM